MSGSNLVYRLDQDLWATIGPYTTSWCFVILLSALYHHPEAKPPPHCLQLASVWPDEAPGHLCVDPACIWPMGLPVGPEIWQLGSCCQIFRLLRISGGWMAWLCRPNRAHRPEVEYLWCIQPAGYLSTRKNLFQEKWKIVHNLNSNKMEYFLPF